MSQYFSIKSFKEILQASLERMKTIATNVIKREAACENWAY